MVTKNKKDEYTSIKVPSEVIELTNLAKIKYLKENPQTTTVYSYQAITIALKKYLGVD